MIKCEVCGGTNVQVACWVRINTNEVQDGYWSWNNCDGNWCEDCGEHTRLIYPEHKKAEAPHDPVLPV